MNPILNEILEDRNGHYCNAVEVSNVYELENLCDEIYNEYIDRYDINIIIDFLNRLSVYYLEPEGEEPEHKRETDEDEVYDFDFEQYIKQL